MKLRPLLAIFAFTFISTGAAFAKPEIAFEYIDKMFAEAVVMPKGELKPVQPNKTAGVILSTEAPTLAKAAFLADNQKISIHPAQMVFKNEAFETNNTFSIVTEKSGKTVLSFDPSRFDLYVVRVNTHYYSVDRPVTLNEVSKKQYSCDVSVSIITQQGTDKKQLTSFYFLIPKESRA